MISHVVASALGGPAGSSDPIASAVLALSPVFYSTFRDGDYVNQGSVGGTGTVTGTLTTKAGPDGNYPRKATTANDGITFPDNAAYSIDAGSGFTIGFFGESDETSLQRWPMGKSGEWSIQNGAFTDGNQIYPQSNTAGNGVARARYYSSSWLTAWTLVICRFTTRTANPTIRVNGVNQTGSIIGSGTGGTDSASLLSFFHRAAGGSWRGSIAHPFIIPGSLADGDLADIESAASSLGWY